jgi:ubiquinone/menaquinone biosynthesis C-methylase UbiE
MRFNKRFIELGSCPRTVTCKIKMLLVKYVYKKITKKMDVVKKILSPALHAKKRNRAVDVHGKGPMNMLVLVLHARL